MVGEVALLLGCKLGPGHYRLPEKTIAGCHAALLAHAGAGEWRNLKEAATELGVRASTLEHHHAALGRLLGPPIRPPSLGGGQPKRQAPRRKANMAQAGEAADGPGQSQDRDAAADALQMLADSSEQATSSRQAQSSMRAAGRRTHSPFAC